MSEVYCNDWNIEFFESKIPPKNTERKGSMNSGARERRIIFLKTKFCLNFSSSSYSVSAFLHSLAFFISELRCLKSLREISARASPSLRCRSCSREAFYVFLNFILMLFFFFRESDELRWGVSKRERFLVVFCCRKWECYFNAV